VRELLDNYLAVVVAGGVGFGLVFVSLVMARILSPRQPSRPKGAPYECGMLPVGRNILQVHVRYYLFAILFLIFDVEAVFLFPWAISFLGIGEVAFYEMLIFIAILGGGLVYAWKKGVLQWR